MSEERYKENNMKIDVKVSIKDAKSWEINELFISALDGHLDAKYATEKGKMEIQKMIDEAISKVANEAFRLGREYTQKA